ncbi:YdhK family protein [Paenibacillus sp. J22TS3]|uniref:YdhK family protein n=1 Tax=Paenibacillus sp. J22TS3 TaxID=2807192 RepID=UPI001BCB5187|nr:YdhK family protein [Paenibacillus sp. J22TS3]
MKKTSVLLGAAFMLALSGCDHSVDQEKTSISTQAEEQQQATKMDHSEMSHSSSGELPPGMQEAKHTAFKPGSQAVVTADHMKGMKGAVATIVGAYDTTVYEVTYTPTNGGEKVKNHRWVVQQEIADAGDKAFKPGEKVTILADHMPGMKGASGTIDSGEKTVVYMIDYTPTTGGDEVKNHKWVTESELEAK